MRRLQSLTAASQRIFKAGGLYLDLARSVLVTVEDHEIREGRRTGRVIVCAADGRARIPLRWLADEGELVEAEVLPSVTADDGEVLL